MSFAHDPRQNYLLAALPSDDRAAALFPQLERVQMPLGMMIYESGRPIQHAYFPTTSIVSLLYETEDGGSAEIAVIGNEGVVGITLFLGGGDDQQPSGCAERWLRLSTARPSSDE